jgi:hypothetical protein
MLKKHTAQVSGVRIAVTGDRWAELTMHDKIQLDHANLAAAVETVRKIFATGQVAIDATAVHFEKGQDFLDWLNEAKVEIKPGEVTQP